MNDCFPTKSYKVVLYLDTDKRAMSLLSRLALRWLCLTRCVLNEALQVPVPHPAGEEEQRRWGKWEVGLKWTCRSYRHKHDQAKLSLNRMGLKAELWWVRIHIKPTYSGWYLDKQSGTCSQSVSHQPELENRNRLKTTYTINLTMSVIKWS